MAGNSELTAVTKGDAAQPSAWPMSGVGLSSSSSGSVSLPPRFVRFVSSGTWYREPQQSWRLPSLKQCSDLGSPTQTQWMAQSLRLVCRVWFAQKISPWVAHLASKPSLHCAYQYRSMSSRVSGEVVSKVARRTALREEREPGSEAEEGRESMERDCTSGDKLEKGMMLAIQQVQKRTNS